MMPSVFGQPGVMDGVTAPVPADRAQPDSGRTQRQRFDPEA